MRRSPEHAMASVAMTSVQLGIQKLGWIFREQPTEDYGIDAHVEIVDANEVGGRLLALQIKGGASRFRETGPGGWWFRPDSAHVAYWIGHSLPVAIVLYNPETERCHWQLVNNDTLVETKTGGWKVLVPDENVIGESARDPLSEAAAGEPYLLRLRELRLARPWMERLANGERLVIDVEEWVNKTSGRGSIVLGVDNEDGCDPTPLATWGVLLSGRSYADVIPRLFGWADVTVHEETYDEADQAEYDAECAIVDQGHYFYAATFQEWRAARQSGLRPYGNESSEVDLWRLELLLNDVGKAFLIIHDYASQAPPQLTP